MRLLATSLCLPGSWLQKCCLTITNSPIRQASVYGTLLARSAITATFLLPHVLYIHVQTHVLYTRNHARTYKHLRTPALTHKVHALSHPPLSSYALYACSRPGSLWRGCQPQCHACHDVPHAPLLMERTESQGALRGAQVSLGRIGVQFVQTELVSPACTL